MDHQFLVCSKGSIMLVGGNRTQIEAGVCPACTISRRVIWGELLHFSPIQWEDSFLLAGGWVPWFSYLSWVLTQTPGVHLQGPGGHSSARGARAASGQS